MKILEPVILNGMADRRNVGWVALLFLICVVFESRFTYDSINDELHSQERARLPFGIKSPTRELEGLTKEAKDAGLTGTDRIVAVDGRSVLGVAPLTAAIRAHRAGDSIQVTVKREGADASATVRLAGHTISASNWALIIFLNYLTPWFSIALGFTVLFLRPRDPLAWLLMLLMLSFSQFAGGNSFVETLLGWNGWMRPAAMFYSTLLSATWALWMMLFGQYFPNREANGIWHRIFRWAVGLPVLIISLLTAVINVAAMDDAAAMSALQIPLMRAGVALIILMMVAIGSFFTNISFKRKSAKAADEKRRLKLLYFGVTASMTPLFLLVIASLILRRQNFGGSGADWYIIPALLALFLFPLTLAYVIVVEKAMDLKVAIRQGLQYALARRGVRGLTILAMIGTMTVGVTLLNKPGVRGPQQIIVMTVMIIIVIRLRMLAERLRSWIDRRFFREAVNTERVLRELGEKVRSIVEMQPLLETVTSTISSALHVAKVAVMTRQNGYFAPAHALGYGSPGPHMHFAATSAVAERLGRSREPLRVSLTRPEAWVDSQVTELGPELLLPLAVKDRLLGFLSLGPKLSEEPYSPTDVALLESLASQTGLALENSRLTEAVASEVAQRERLNRELEIAREVQQRLFPQSGPEIAGLDYAGKCRPASSVGGDYYDFVSMCDGRLGIAIGDISGKGVPAALLMASLQASLRGLAISNPPELSPLMVNLNRLIYDASPSNRYATFFYGVYDPKSREFMYVNGGHNPPMIFRGGEVLRLEEGGPVVGLFGPAQYAQGVVTLEVGDTMVLFTDGVSEAMNGADEEFDEPRLIEAVRSGAGMKAVDLIDHIIRECDAFVAGAPQHDDMTIVIARVT
jgi:sigma-B regulation protein RsbU (phosphoserine phosphatase)